MEKCLLNIFFTYVFTRMGVLAASMLTDYKDPLFLRDLLVRF